MTHWCTTHENGSVNYWSGASIPPVFNTSPITSAREITEDEAVAITCRRACSWGYTRATFVPPPPSVQLVIAHAMGESNAYFRHLAWDAICARLVDTTSYE